MTTEWGMNLAGVERVFELEEQLDRMQRKVNVLERRAEQLRRRSSGWRRSASPSRPRSSATKPPRAPRSSPYAGSSSPSPGRGRSLGLARCPVTHVSGGWCGKISIGGAFSAERSRGAGDRSGECGGVASVPLASLLLSSMSLSRAPRRCAAARRPSAPEQAHHGDAEHDRDRGPVVADRALADDRADGGEHDRPADLERGLHQAGGEALLVVGDAVRGLDVRATRSRARTRAPISSIVGRNVST